MFKAQNFILASGQESNWKIECDDLTTDDWACLAKIAIKYLPPFYDVEGVPTGGIPFADALSEYTSESSVLLIADDVWTTGGSMKRHAAGRNFVGVVLFARGPVDANIIPLFTFLGARSTNG